MSLPYARISAASKAPSKGPGEVTPRCHGVCQ